jgi:hypothetical protein
VWLQRFSEQTVVSKHVAVYTTQTDCCDVYCYGIGWKLCNGDRKVSKHVAVYITHTVVMCTVTVLVGNCVMETGKCRNM